MESGSTSNLKLMRLRSSQFVFLMLLICSVQVREEYARSLRDDAPSSRPAASSHHREEVAESARPLTPLNVHFERRNTTKSQDAAAQKASRTPWTMPPPALGSAALVSFTGFLRA